MKKLLGVSIAALLVASPMMANAALGTPGNNKVTWSDGSAASEPAPTIQGLNQIATITYVQGAYDALAGAHNALDSRVGTLEGDDQTTGSVLKGIKDNARNATFVPGANTQNLSGVSNINTAITTLDTDMGQVSSLSSGTSDGDALYNYSGDLVGAVKTIANRLDSSNSDASVGSGTYIGSSHSAGTVSSALSALDTAVSHNSDAIGASNAATLNTALTNATLTDKSTVTGAITELSNRVVTVYTTWSDTTKTGEVALGNPTP